MDATTRAEPLVPVTPVVSAHALSEVTESAILGPNVLSVSHMERLRGGLLYAASSHIPWATLLARTFDVDVTACARCGGRLRCRNRGDRGLQVVQRVAQECGGVRLSFELALLQTEVVTSAYAPSLRRFASFCASSPIERS